MITGLPLQNKLRTYKNWRKKKTTSELFFSQSGLDSPPPPPTHTHRQTRRKFPGSAHGFIRYRGGRETISLLKTFYNAAKI